MLSRARVLTLLIAFTVVLSPIKVFAVDDVEYDQTFYSGNNIQFFDPRETCGDGSTPVTSTLISSGNAKKNLESIMTYFVDKGLTVAAAAGIAGNIKSESGYEPAIIQGGARAPAAKQTGGSIDTSSIYKPVNEVGFGLSQWTYGGTSSPRQGPLYNSAVRLKIDIISMRLQLDYIWQELNTSYKTSTLDRIQDLTDPREATKIYMVNYEGPADQSAAAQNARADNGEAIYNQFKDTLSDGSGITSTSNSTICTVDAAANNGGGVGIANGFTFPLRTTQYKIKNGIEGAVWCFSSANNCHHDYNAADIFAETGTPIIAAKPGVVVNKTTGSCDYYGCNVSIMGEDGILYYYTHMSKHASVNVGQKISAGQQIGSVGTNATAMNTPRHLHFDMLPGDKYKYRPGCSSAACKSYPFINVQSYLVPAFDQLPKGTAGA